MISKKGGEASGQNQGVVNDAFAFEGALEGGEKNQTGTVKDKMGQITDDFRRQTMCLGRY